MKKVLSILRDIFEFYIPLLSFIFMFVSFLLQVFFRYVVRHPLTWTQEVIVQSFVWTVIFGACYTMRQRSHIKFTMIYDRLKPKPAAVIRMSGNIIIVVAFLLLIIPSYKYSFFIGFQKTAVFRISFTFMFISFVYFLCSIIGYTVADIIEDIKVIRGIISDSKDHGVSLGVQK